MTNFKAINEALRMGDMSEAVRLAIQDAINSLKEHHYVFNQQQLIRMEPNSRRAEYYCLLKVAANKLNAYADEMLAEEKRAQEKS